MAESTGTPSYSQPLLDAVALFDELGIGYALIGGVASMYYGRPRFTEDVDFVASEGHMTTLERHADAMQTRHPTCVWKLYHSSGVEIDIWKDEHATEIIERARDVDLHGTRVRVADPHDLIAMKLRAGRLRDDYDISEILKGTNIDDALIRDRVSDESFARYQLIKARR